MRALRIVGRVLLWAFAVLGLASTCLFVYLAYVQSARCDRCSAARAQIRHLEAALELYQVDNGLYPTTRQGLEALVSKPDTEPVPENYRRGGYLAGGSVPLDPWGGRFNYVSPGVHDPTRFDLWSLGADGVVGGDDYDADVSTWQEPPSD